MHRCVWCYVAPGNLGGHVYTDWAREYRRGKAKSRDLPKELVEDPRISPENTFKHYLQMHTKKPLDAVCIGSSEPLTFLPAIKRFSELVKRNGIPFIVGIDSTGFQFNQNPELIEELNGLEEVIHFVIATFKGRNPTEHIRATTSSADSWRAGINSQDLLLRKGFWTIPAGITLNTFAHPNPRTLETVAKIDPKFVKDSKFTMSYREYLAEKTAEWLHDQLSTIHPDYPRLLHYNKLTYGRVSAPKHQLRQMREAGFVDCKPSIFEQTLKRVFEKRGTPIIQYDRKQYSTIHPRYGEVMRQIIADKKDTPINQSLAYISGVEI
ncbi:MAG: hypothetical protein HY094_04075 [Candidatus Melainabacteria bacterium]|nr:hypothetical protein [Candidatus Melainabacteria bacterium]